MFKNRYRLCYCYGGMMLKQKNAAEPPVDVVNLFNQYSENGVMTVEHLHKFLVEFQGDETATVDDAHAILHRLKHLHVFHRKGLHLDHFFRFVFGDLNSSPLASLGVHHDMTAPLAHYFLYTGHNSYLTGNQLSSDSSIDPIVKALRIGVRVIELDLWPNSRKNDVEVFHGGTMTSPVELIKCLEAIKENAFYASEYPVIITFEDHLDSFLQAKVAQMVKKTFGEMLFTSMDFQEFPSPESLKRKILISTKPPKESMDSPKADENNTEQKVYRCVKISTKSIGNGVGFAKKKVVHIQVKPQSEMEEEEEEGSVSEYKDLISVHKVKGKGGLDNLLRGDPKRAARLSLGEQKLQNAVKTHGPDIIRFTQTNLLRVYPKGTRILSSNYNPLLGWTHGVQMVAFNMQGYGKYLWIMQGMFRANGGCGYVKKPDFLLKSGPNNEVFNPNISRQVKKTLKVKVYMGDGWHLEFRQKHSDAFSRPDFFTKLQILGVPADNKKVMTKPVEDEWIPTWNKEFEFPLTVPELALLRIEVRDYNMSGRHDFGGQTCLPVSELRSGIRTIPLYNKKGQKYKYVKLLMQFQFT